MATVDLTQETFKDTVDNNGIVLVDFWASWCGPCQSFAPVYDRVSEEHQDVVFAKVDTEAQQELAAAFAIRSIPTLMAFRDNVLLFNQAGALPQASLEDLIEQIKDIDMEEIRRQMAAEENADHDH
ncbi:MAG: thioredoxin [Nitriliruptoraceae bacterium]